MASWTDDPVTTSTHIRAVHVNELRRTVLRNRYKVGLGGVTWSDGPWVTSRTHIRAIHFTEVHDAMTPYLGALIWSVGSPPAPSRQVSARDINDLRAWCDQFSTDLSLPTGPDPAEEGITSFSFDPTTTPQASIDASWVADIAGLTPTTTPLWIRIRIIADSSDNIVPYYFPYQVAFQYYQNANMPVQALLTSDFARSYEGHYNDNVSDPFFTNPFIDYFSARAADFATNMVGYNASSYIIWNEPSNQGSTTSLDARVFASLLYHCFTQINDAAPGAGVIMGGILWQDTINHDQATQAVVQYLSQIYTWLRNNGLGVPWDAVNLHPHNCGDPNGYPAGFSQQDMTNLRSAIDNVFSLSDRRPVFIGEWGPTHSGALNQACMGNAYTYLREVFDAMWYFQHPNRTTTGDCTSTPGDYGTTAWTYVQGTSYQDCAVTAHCPEWAQLSTLLEQRNS
ncbi:MAG: hypothetical protein M1118_05895 [Chloroflexi bacterium]|nr:hypothetical protein [Chloroflexota bacterium]